MRLTELSPEWVEKSEKDPNRDVERYIHFNCPTCPADDTCYGMLLPVARTGGNGGWGWNGEEDFEKVTLTPSIWHHCKTDPHFHITNGEILLV